MYGYRRTVGSAWRRKFKPSIDLIPIVADLVLAKKEPIRLSFGDPKGVKQSAGFKAVLPARNWGFFEKVFC
jgi:hypothetical protein